MAGSPTIRLPAAAYAYAYAAFGQLVLCHTAVVAFPHLDFRVAASAAAPVIALANQVTLSGLVGWTWSPAPQDAVEGVLVPFPMRESFSWPIGIGVVNLLLQTFALVVALFSLLFGRDVFWIAAPTVAVVESAGLVLILGSAMVARHSRELQRIRKHVTHIETPRPDGLPLAP